MSVFTAGASDTNAKLVRSLAHSLKTNSANCKPLLDYCRSQNAFSAISADDAALFFDTVTAVLTSAHEQTASLSLQVLYHALSSIPPYLLRPHWLLAAQKLTSLLKSSKSSENPRLQAKLLTVMASAVSSAAPFPLLEPEMKAVVSKVCQSALFHALRALQPTQVTDYMCKAALCLIFAVLSTAPREVRTILSQLETGIRERFLFHRSSSVRNTAALLSAHLLACHAGKARIKVFEQRLNEACKQLHDIINMVDVFGPSDGEKRSGTFDETLQKLSVSELQLRVSMTCSYIRHVVELRQDVLMPMPLAALYRVLLRGIEERHVDAYAARSDTNLLDTDSVFLLINTVTSECAETLVRVTEACGKDATIVFTHQIGQCLETKLSHVVLRSRTEAGVDSNICERALIYRMVGGMIEVMGCGLLEYVSGMLEELFSAEVKLHVACRGSHALLVEEKHDVTEGNNRSRKRKRYQNDEGRQKSMPKSKCAVSKATPLNPLDKYCAQSAYTSKQSLQEALRCVTGVFELRGYISKQVSEHLRRIEHGIMKMMKEGAVFEEVLHAASAAGLSGGCNRMYAEASDLLVAASRMCGGASTGFGDVRVQREARRSRSGFESIIHARGPAFCAGKRSCDQTSEEKLVVSSTGLEITDAMELRDDGGGGNDVGIARCSRDNGGEIKAVVMNNDASGTEGTHGVIGDGKNSKLGEDVDMTDGTDQAAGGMDGTAALSAENRRKGEESAHGHEGDSRESDKAGDTQDNHEGEHIRDSVTTRVNCDSVEAKRVENNKIDIHEVTHDGEARLEVATATMMEEDLTKKADFDDDGSQMEDRIHGEAQPWDNGQVAGSEGAGVEEEDEEELIQSLNFAPPDGSS